MNFMERVYNALDTYQLFKASSRTVIVGPVAFHPREAQIISLVVEGKTNKQIGAVIGTTETMTKQYLRYIFDRVGCSTRLELTVWWLNHTEANGNKDNILGN